MSELMRGLGPKERGQLQLIAEAWRAQPSPESAAPDTIERAVTAVYSEAELAPPQRFIWVESPLAGADIALTITAIHLGDPVACQLAECRVDAIWSAALDRLSFDVIDEVRALIDADEWSPEREKPWQRREGDIDAVTGSSIEHWGRALISPHFSQYWAAWVACFASLGVSEAREYRLGLLGTAGSWLWAFENVAIVSRSGPQPPVHPL